jgi:hypothetical protein
MVTMCFLLREIFLNRRLLKRDRKRQNKVAIVHSMRAHRRSKLYSSTHSQPLHQMQVKGQHRDSAALHTGKYRSTHSIGPQSRSGWSGGKKKILPPPEFKHRPSRRRSVVAVPTTLRRLSVRDNHVSTKRRAVYF